MTKLSQCKSYCSILLDDFLKRSWPCVKAIVEKLELVKTEGLNRKISLFRFEKDRRVNVPFEGVHFFLRGSVEYTNPHLTIEEVQGIMALRLLEACGNYFYKTGLHEPSKEDFLNLCEALKKPPEGMIVPYLLNTDDVEADRYSMNPLRTSLISSGQSAFPAAYIKTNQLKIDDDFLNKYNGKLISKTEKEIIQACLSSEGESYLDFVDAVKYTQLDKLSEIFDINLSLYSLRMPISTLQQENKDDVLHYIISQAHRDLEAINEAYSCMGRSITKRTTLLIVPHSKKGFGSKRAARGKLHFMDSKLYDVNIKYKLTKLYPNSIEPSDVCTANADDDFNISGEKFIDYNFKETPSSPQFFLYALGSPEDAAIWHGIGVFAAPQLLQSYASARKSCREGRLIKNLSEKYKVKLELPLQFNLAPNGMWNHPVYKNIDASIGCVDNLEDLVNRGMWLEHLSNFK